MSYIVFCTRHGLQLRVCKFCFVFTGGEGFNLIHFSIHLFLLLFPKITLVVHLFLFIFIHLPLYGWLWISHSNSSSPKIPLLILHFPYVSSRHDWSSFFFFCVIFSLFALIFFLVKKVIYFNKAWSKWSSSTSQGEEKNHKKNIMEVSFGEGEKDQYDVALCSG